MPSKKSGGARAVEAKHRARDARRPKGWATRQRKAYRQALAGKEGLERVIAAAQWAMDWAAQDPGMPPEYIREQVIRAAQGLAKVIDPQRELASRDADLRAAAQLIESLEAKLRVARAAPRSASGDSPPPQH